MNLRELILISNLDQLINGRPVRVGVMAYQYQF